MNDYHITEVADFNDTITVRTPADTVVLGTKAAARVWVHPVEGEVGDQEAEAVAVAAERASSA